MVCFVVAEFLLTSVSRRPSAIAEPLVIIYICCFIINYSIFYSTRLGRLLCISTLKFHLNQCKCFWDIDFPDGDMPPCWIFKRENYIWRGLEDWGITMPNFVEIHPSIAEMLRFFDFYENIRINEIWHVLSWHILLHLTRGGTKHPIHFQHDSNHSNEGGPTTSEFLIWFVRIWIFLVMSTRSGPIDPMASYALDHTGQNTGKQHLLAGKIRFLQQCGHVAVNSSLPVLIISTEQFSMWHETTKIYSVM